MRLSNGLDMVGEQEGGIQVASYVSGLYNSIEVPLSIPGIKEEHLLRGEYPMFNFSNFELEMSL